MKKAISVLVFMLGGIVMSAELELGNGDSDNTYNDIEAFKVASKIVKTGSGRTFVDFGDAKSGYKGEIEVREGILAVNLPRNLGAPSRITVSDGATLDISPAVSGNTDNFGDTVFFISGAGKGGIGAVRRVGGGTVNGMFGGIVLEGDALLHFTSQTGMKGDATSGATVALNGNALSVDGGGIFYCPNTQFTDGEGQGSGTLNILSGTFFPRYGALSSGTKDNALVLSSGSVLRLRELSSKPIWKLRTVKSASERLVVKIENDKYISSDIPDVHNVWAGDVEMGVQLTMSPSPIKSHFTLAGSINGDKTLAIANGEGTGKVVGNNEVAQLTVRSGTMFVGGGTTKVGGILDQSAGELVVSNAHLHWSSPEVKELLLGGENSRGVLSIRKDGVMHGDELDGIGASARLCAGKNANEYGIVRMSEGSVVSNVNFSLGISGFGALYQSGGKIEWPLGNAADNAAAVNGGSYAYFGIGGGFKMRCTENGAAGARFGENGTAVFAVRGNGIFEMDNTKTGKINFGSGDTGMVQWYQDRGAKSSVKGYFDFGDVSDRVHTGAAVLTVAGEGTELVVSSVNNDNCGIRMLWTKTGSCGIVNVNDGGTITSPRMYKVSENAKWYLNVNGGVLRPGRGGVYTYEDNAKRLPDRAIVYEKGIVIDTSLTVKDDGSYDDVKLHIAFAKPASGKRIASIALPEDDAFKSEALRLVGPAVVTVDGDGEGACAFALYDDIEGALADIAVVGHGCGYTRAEATLSGGGLAGAYACAVTLEDQPVAGWKGLVKRGMGKLILLGENSFCGDVTVEDGILVFQNANAAQSGMPSGAGIILKNENSVISFKDSNTPVSVPFFVGCGQANNGIFTVTDRIECKADDIFNGRFLRFLQWVFLADGVEIVVTDPENLGKYARSAPAKVLEAAKGLVCEGEVRLVFGNGNTTNSPDRWVLATKGKALTLKPRRGTVMVLR